MPPAAASLTDVTLGKLTLEVRGPRGSKQTVVLSSACCRIGSGDSCVLRLRAPGVRDVHCVVFRGPRRTVVRSLAKETWLNGGMFFESPLAVGDCLRVGQLEIVVLEDERLHSPVHERSAVEMPETFAAAHGTSPHGDRPQAELQLEQLVAAQTSELPAGRLAPRGGTPDATPGAKSSASHFELATIVTDVVKSVRAVEEQIGRYDQRLADCASQTSAATEALTGIRADHAGWDAQLRDWKAELQQIDVAGRQSLAALQQRLSVLEIAAAQVVETPAAEPLCESGDVDNLRDQIDSLQSHVDSLRGQMDDLRQQLDKLRSQSDARIEALGQLIEQSRSQSEERHETLRQSGESLRQTIEQARTAAERPLANLREEMATLQQRAEQLAAELPHAISELREQRTADASLVQQLLERCEQIESTVAELGEAKSSRQVTRHEADVPQQAMPSADVEPVWGQTCMVSPVERQQWLTANESIASESTSPIAELPPMDEEGPTGNDTCETFPDDADESGVDPNANDTCLLKAEKRDFEEPDADESPEPGEELTFSQDSRESPLSTADVLRRMGASLDFSDDEPELTSAKLPQRPPLVPRRTEPDSTRLPLSSRPTEFRDPEEEDGAMIEEYMSQLLQRMRPPTDDIGSTNPVSQTTSALTGPFPSRATKSFMPVEPAVPPQDAVTEESTGPLEMTPRALPAELTADMSAMRVLANSTARAAINIHQRRGQMRVTQGKLVVAGVAVAAGIFLWFFSGGSKAAIVSSFVAVAIAGWWIAQYFMLTAKLRRESRRFEKGKKPTATTAASPAADAPEAPAVDKSVDA